MKVLAITVFAVAIVSISAAPALVWKDVSTNTSPTIHSSEPIHVSSLMSSAFSKDNLSSLDVFFFVRRSNDGNEALSKLTSSGSLPTVATHYESAESVNHYVHGMDDSKNLLSVARGIQTDSSSPPPMEISLKEFERKISAEPPSSPSEVEEGNDVRTVERKKTGRERAVEKARVVIVRATPKESAALDAAVSKAIQSPSVNSVILAGQRSIMEKRGERNMDAKRRLAEQKRANSSSHRRRLEDAQQNDDNDDDLTGVYYVNMTPNILAGILFTLFFAYVAMVGINCLGAIQGNDIYPSKYPYIGREA